MNTTNQKPWLIGFGIGTGIGLAIGVAMGVLLTLAVIRFTPRPQVDALDLAAIQQRLPEVITPMTAEQLATKEPRSYQFGQGQGQRLWKRLDAHTWHELYPDGFTSVFKVLGHTTVEDTEGTIVVKVSGAEARSGTSNDGNLQAFIPDKGSERMHHWFRNTTGGDTRWHDLAAMTDVQ